MFTNNIRVNSTPKHSSLYFLVTLQTKKDTNTTSRLQKDYTNFHGCFVFLNINLTTPNPIVRGIISYRNTNFGILMPQKPTTIQVHKPPSLLSQLLLLQTIVTKHKKKLKIFHVLQLLSNV